MGSDCRLQRSEEQTRRAAEEVHREWPLLRYEFEPERALSHARCHRKPSRAASAVDHIRYPDLLELMEVPDRETGTLGLKPDYLPIILRAKDRMLRNGRWKLVCQPLNGSHKLMLFDLESDPECKNDVISQQPEIAKRLWQQLNQWIKLECARFGCSVTTCPLSPSSR